MEVAVRNATPRYRAATVSTYIVGFLLFLAEYFWWYAFRSMFIAPRTGFVKTSTFQKMATTSRLRSRFGQSLLPNRDREGVIRSLRPAEGDEDAKWFNSWQA